MNYLDLTLLLILLISAYGGYKSGLIKSIFKTIGYIAGGLLAVVIAVNYADVIDNIALKALFALLLIFLLANLGEFILGKFGSLFRKALFIPPFKLLDSLFGASLSLLRTTFISYLFLLVLLATPWSIGDTYITPSKFYKYANTYLPSVITDLKAELDQLFKELN